MISETKIEPESQNRKTLTAVPESQNRKTLTVVLVALYRYQNFAIRILHSILENIKGDGLVKTQTAPFADRLRCWGVPAGKSRNWFKIQEHRS